MDERDVDAAMDNSTPVSRTTPVQVKRRDVAPMIERQSSQYECAVDVANKYPRSITDFRQAVRDMATLTPDVAAECAYSVPRSGKTIVGPSARFAEILANSWRHLAVQSYIIEEGEKTVTARGTAWDMQANVMVECEVQRSIMDRHWHRFKDDMVRTTCNAAMSIARRNAILTIIPRPHWLDILAQAQQTALGKPGENLKERREALVAHFGELGVTKDMLFDRMQVSGIDDITIELIAEMRSLAASIKGGDLTVDEVFRGAGSMRTPFDPAAMAAGGDEIATPDPLMGGG